MKRLPKLVLVVLLIAAAGCARQKAVTELERKQAANLASEAQFAATVRDYTRAEGLFAQAAELCPDTGAYWLSLGSMRMRLAQRAPARDAYQRALGAFEKAAATEQARSESSLQQVYVLALLGRTDDARKLQTKLVEKYPNDRDVRAFVDNHSLDRILSDPKFKDFAVQ